MDKDNKVSILEKKKSSAKDATFGSMLATAFGAATTLIGPAILTQTQFIPETSWSKRHAQSCCFSLPLLADLSQF